MVSFTVKVFNFAVAILNLASPSGVEPETKPSQGLMISYFTTGINLVDAVGFEPTCSYERIYSPSPSASRSHVQFVNTLLGMCVLKHTRLPLQPCSCLFRMNLAQVQRLPLVVCICQFRLKVCFNTL